MEGGTTFHFLDASPAEALAEARKSAPGLDIRIGGGPSVIRQFLAADLIDHMHIAIVPIVLGRGERLWDDQEGLEERFEIESVSSPSGVTHMIFHPPLMRSTTARARGGQSQVSQRSLTCRSPGGYSRSSCPGLMR